MSPGLRKTKPRCEGLRAKGVVFEDYDMPEIGLKTVNGVAEVEGTKAATLGFLHHAGDARTCRNVTFTGKGFGILRPQGF